MNYTKIILLLSFVILSFNASGNQIEEEQRMTYGELIVLPPMSIPRYNHTADIVSGALIIAGGTSDGSSSLDSCEILDLRDGQWRDMAPMSDQRMRHASVSTCDRLIVTGGYQGRGHPSLYRHYMREGNISLSSCEIYDPYKNEWERMPSLLTGRFWHEMIVHPTLGILVIGGLNTSVGAVSSCERYDEEVEEWKEFPSLPEPLARFSIGILPGGDIIIAGGHNGLEKRSSNRTYIFDIETGVWKEASPMGHSRGYAGFCTMDGGKFAVSGGFTEPGSPDRRDAEVFDPEKNRWEPLGELMFPRHGHGSVWIEGSGLLIAGGSNCETGGCHSNLEIFDPDLGVWSDSGHLVVARKWCGVVSDQEGGVYITGGKACDYSTSNTDLISFTQVRSEEPKTYADIDPAVVLLAVLLIIILVVSVHMYLRKGGR